MHYYEIYALLKERFSADDDNCIIDELGITIEKVKLISENAAAFLPGSSELYCRKHKVSFEEKCHTLLEDASGIAVSDYDIPTNKACNYYILKLAGQKQADGYILFFHGLNEKRWDKYLPWAYEIARRTNKALVLFPIAFHMDRAPATWSEKQRMIKIANERIASNPENAHNASFINAAISSRLEHFPQRLFWSGMQTYADVVQFIESVKKGQQTAIKPEASIDLFGYSIGSFLSSILLMANPHNYLFSAKLFCYCGGMTIDRMFPVSKYIMDASSAIAMQGKYAELLSANFTNDARMEHYQNAVLHPETSWFKTMLRYNYFSKEREERLRELAPRVKALVLKQDEVAHPVEALNTLKGGYRDIPIEVEITDYNYPYTHMNPFSLVHKFAEEVDQAFEGFVQSMANFYNEDIE